MKETETNTVDALDKKSFTLRQIVDYAVNAILDSNNDADHFEIKVYGVEINISRRKTIDFSDME